MKIKIAGHESFASVLNHFVIAILLLTISNEDKFDKISFILLFYYMNSKNYNPFFYRSLKNFILVSIIYLPMFIAYSIYFILSKQSRKKN